MGPSRKVGSNRVGNQRQSTSLSDLSDSERTQIEGKKGKAMQRLPEKRERQKVQEGGPQRSEIDPSQTNKHRRLMVEDNMSSKKKKRNRKEPSIGAKAGQSKRKKNGWPGGWL